MSERLKIVRSPVRSRPKPQVVIIGSHAKVVTMWQRVIALSKQYKSLHRWALVGVITFTIDYLIFILIYSSIESVLLANFCAGLVSISFNYTAHYFWSFKSESDHSKSGVKYLFNLIIFWTVSTLLLKVLITAGIEAKYAKFIPVPIIAPLSFLGLKFFVFNMQKLPSNLLIFGLKKTKKQCKPK